MDMGILDFLIGRDARKFIKRKDSDAGEAGRALEELRSSLYNELRTSEGAKRQQQRLCGPTVAMTFNFLVAVGIIMANKLVMGKIGFNFPIFLTLIHYFSSWVLLAIFKALSLLPTSPPAKSTPFSSLFSLGTVMALSTGLANVSLKHNSVGFYQMAKISVTPTIVLAEFLLFRKMVSFNKVIALSIVSVGVAVATVTDLEFNFFGACISLAWIIPSAMNKILWSNMQQKGNWTALALMWKTTPVTIFFLLVLMPWLDPPGVLSFNWDLTSTSVIIISAGLGFLLQWSGALALGATSATSHVVLGQFKTCVIMLGGYLIFNSDPGLMSICGATVALCGMAVYTSLNLRESKESSSKQLAKQLDSSSSKPKTSVGVSTEKPDVKSTTTSTV
ncbi:PREDICTED: uncharacterized membrane protein At1g06890 [Nelumbo nucifera]|uniref:Uncharacterized membrane protein At1g06890 n=2 Tax=Nelumbo nucifera TaxID=4432 RepID=A0A1U7ZUZ7_NELNU|nr:PREDICTED: uncharacterized membrane protein At1g06890 [Nelumbo nucifera]DAD23701.1 TPA_asm: hypothetical protein HUJ06_025164 [Nelumbo nucifera]